MHGIGDRGVREILNAVEATINEQNIENPPIHRITHCEQVDEADVPRFVELGVAADFQVAGDFALPNHRVGTYLLAPARALH